MPLLESIRSALGLDAAQEEAAVSEHDEARIAAAALAVHVIAVDGVVEEAERQQLRTALSRHFELDDAQTASLISEAQTRDQEAVDLYGFTSVLNRKMDDEGRLRVVELLWQMVYADGSVHEFEDNILWRIAELLHVPPRERIRLRKQVERDLGDS